MEADVRLGQLGSPDEGLNTEGRRVDRRRQQLPIVTKEQEVTPSLNFCFSATSAGPLLGGTGSQSIKHTGWAVPASWTCPSHCRHTCSSGLCGRNKNHRPTGLSEMQPLSPAGTPLKKSQLSLFRIEDTQ